MLAQFDGSRLLFWFIKALWLLPDYNFQFMLLSVFAKRHWYIVIFRNIFCNIVFMSLCTTCHLLLNWDGYSLIIALRVKTNLTVGYINYTIPLTSKRDQSNGHKYLTITIFKHSPLIWSRKRFSTMLSVNYYPTIPWH